MEGGKPAVNNHSSSRVRAASPGNRQGFGLVMSGIGGKQFIFPSHPGYYLSFYIFLIAINIVLGVLARDIRQENEIERYTE